MTWHDTQGQADVSSKTITSSSNLVHVSQSVFSLWLTNFLSRSDTRKIKTAYVGVLLDQSWTGPRSYQDTISRGRREPIIGSCSVVCCTLPVRVVGYSSIRTRLPLWDGDLKLSKRSRSWKWSWVKFEKIGSLCYSIHVSNYCLSVFVIG